MKVIQVALQKDCPREGQVMVSTPPKDLQIRKRMEKSLQSWRQGEAQRRNVHEQVVLPTHCIRRLAQGKEWTQESIENLPGLGQSRARRYSKQLAALIHQS